MDVQDYLRVVLLFASFYCMPTNPWLTSALYMTCSLMDELDGYLARRLNQQSKLGAIIDLLVDEVTNICMCSALCHYYPSYMLCFQFSIALNIVSHWFHGQSSLMKGSSSHKLIDESANPLLRFYYENGTFLSVMCIGNDLFFCMLYLVYFTEGPAVLSVIGLCRLVLYMCAPVAFIKAGIHMLQLGVAMSDIANIDMKERAAKAKERIRQKSN